MATNANLLARIVLLENRVKALELVKPDVDYSASLTNLQAQIDEIRALTCPETARFAAIETALGILNSDHVPA